MKTLMQTSLVLLGLFIVGPYLYGQTIVEAKLDTTTVQVVDLTIASPEVKLVNNLFEKASSREEILYNGTRVGGKTLKGGLIGLGAGGLVGGITGAVTFKECNEEGLACFMSTETRGEAFLTGVFVGGIIGGVTGLIIGAISESSENSPPSFVIGMRPVENIFSSPRSKPTLSLTVPIGYGSSRQ